MKWWRDLKYWIKENQIIESIIVYLLIGCMITNIIYFFSFSPKAHKDDSAKYCTWKPERTASAIYWAAEYAPRKITCFFWQPWNKKEKL